MSDKARKKDRSLTKKFVCFFWPFRESLGSSIKGVNFKMGEIANVAHCTYLFCLPKRKISNLIHKKIIFMLFIYILLIVVPSLLQINYINVSFFVKSLAKSILCFLLTYLTITREYSFSKKNVDVLFKWTIVVELLFFILQYVFKKHILDFNFQDLPEGTLFINNISRFTGSASEPAYLVPILAPCCYYFSKNFHNHKIYCIVSHVLLILTFSAFGFLTLFIELIYIFLDATYKQKKTFIAIGFGAILTATIIVISSDKLLSLFLYYLNKVESYFSFLSFESSFNHELEWSAADRSQNVVIALKIFFEGNFLQQFFGRGTGAYYFLQNDYGILVDGTEEAYNLYLSTLTDRGLIGLLSLVILFLLILKIPAYDVTTKALRYGCIIQMVHYFFVGNMWLYFFWQEIIMLIGFSFSKKENFMLSEHIFKG